jgi:hypothetical protein
MSVRRSCPMWVWLRKDRAATRLMLGLGSAGILLAARPARGGPSDIAVRIKCPVLSDVSAAELEVRAKVDLSARANRGGELEVVCDDLAARIRWRERGGAWFARSMPRSASPATLIDALLVASKELVEDASRVEKSGGSAGENEQGGATDRDPPSRADAQDPSGAEQSPPRAGDRAAAERRDGRDVTPETAAGSTHRSDVASASRAWVWGVSAGAGAALFSLRGTGTVGPSAGVFVQLPAGIVASVTGHYDLSLGAGDTVSVQMASAAAAVGAAFGPARAFEFGVGGFAGSVFVSADAPFEPTSHSQGLWGALVRARYALWTEAWRLAIGPDVRFYGFRPNVAVDGVWVWGIPVASFGLSLEVSRAFDSSR